MMFRLALRNLLRNRWRSGLTLGGIILATGLTVWVQAFFGAYLGQMVDGMTGVQLGDMQVHTKAYVDEPSIYYGFDVAAEQLDELNGIEGVAGAAPRIHAFGLVGDERASVVAMVVGVDPTREPTVTTVQDKLTKGRWLSATPPKRLTRDELDAGKKSPREVIIGATMAKQLKVELGDSLVIFANAAGGFLGDDSLEVVGVFKSGNSDLDRMGAIMHIEDLAWLTALEGKAHEVALKFDKGVALEKVADAVRTTLPKPEVADEEGTATLVGRTWKQIIPEVNQLVEVSSNSVWIMYLIIFLLAGLGILNTQRMSALERRREFGVLLAIGTTPGHMGRMVMAETITITMVGAILGAAAGMGLVYYHSVVGFDMGTEFSYGGVTFDSTFFFNVSADILVAPLSVLTVVGLLCGIWPAVSSARLNMVSAIAGRGA